ncbi:MAG: carboxypeptidase regulatory-like domain-containing protein [Blastocatellia bacterium]
MRNALATVIGLLLIGATVAAQPRHTLRGWRQTETSGKSDKRAGIISGRLTDSTGQPLNNATVHIVRVSGYRRDVRHITTDEQGRFRVSDLRRGVYRLSLDVPGYVLPEEDAPRQTVRVGDTVNLTLVKGGVITGSVMSHASEPMTGCTVQAVRVGDKDGRPTLNSRSITLAEVDDRGVYRLYGLMPGRYIVAALGRHPYANLSDIFPDDVPTFYPSATRDTAQPVTVRAGEEISSIDIHYRGERGHAISGKLIGLPTDSPNVNTTLQLFSVTTRASEEANYDGTTFVRNESGFAFYGLADGDYIIAASTSRADGQFSGGGRARAKVRGADATGIELKIIPYGAIAGTLVIEPLRQADAQNRCEVKRRLTVDEMLIKAEREKPAGETPLYLGTLYQSEPSEQGEFTLTSLEAGQYHIEAAMLGDNFFVRSITLPGAAKNQPPADAARGPLMIEPGKRLENLIVTVAEGAAAVQGIVTSATEGARRPDRLFVYLVPAEKEAADTALRYYQAEVNGDRFEFTNLSPGRYLVIARPPFTDTTNGGAVRPLVWKATERATLLKQAAAANPVLELRPCQRLVDYSISYEPAAKKNVASRTP